MQQILTNAFEAHLYSLYHCLLNTMRLSRYTNVWCVAGVAENCEM